LKFKLQNSFLGAATKREQHVLLIFQIN
jgi:hypothetical protein